MLRWIRWMLVDSSGSMKPLARPTATQFFFQCSRRWPGRNLMTRGSVSTLPSMLASSVCLAWSSLEVAAAVDHAVADAMLQRNAPLPAGIARDRARVGPAPRRTDSVCSATALSL